MDWEEEEDGTTKSCTSVRLHSKYLGGSQRVCPHAERKDREQDMPGREDRPGRRSGRRGAASRGHGDEGAGEDRGDRGSAPAAARRKRD
jgi:hypothetical protein